MLKNNTFPWGIYIGDLINKQNKTIPLCLDSKQGGFCVLFDEESEEVANSFMENVALKLFELMPLGSLEVTVFDFARPRFMRLSALKSKNLYNIMYSKDTTNNQFDTIEKLELNRLHNLLSFDAPTISEYNKKHSKQETFYLLLINLDDFPNEINSVKRIKNFFNASYDAGFYCIAFGSQDVLENKSEATESILNKFPSIQITNNQFKISKNLFDFNNEEFEFKHANENKDKIIEQLLSQFENEIIEETKEIK